METGSSDRNGEQATATSEFQNSTGMPREVHVEGKMRANGQKRIV